VSPAVASPAQRLRSEPPQYAGVPTCQQWPHCTSRQEDPAGESTTAGSGSRSGCARAVTKGASRAHGLPSGPASRSRDCRSLRSKRSSSSCAPAARLLAVHSMHVINLIHLYCEPSGTASGLPPGGRATWEVEVSVSGAAVSASALLTDSRDDVVGQRPAFVQVLRPVPIPVNFGVCQMCLTSPADAVIGDQPWCRPCRDTYEVERLPVSALA
jgi:hypothetical protein